MQLVEPAFHSAPPRISTDGPIVADLAALAGFPPDPEQAMLLDDWFAIGPNGKSASMELAVICARQNLKTGLLKMAALGWLFITKERLITWSAHEFSAAREAMRDMTELIEGCPSLSKRVKSITTGNGNERIELKDRRRIIFKARTDSGGRSLSGDKVILDEGFALKPEQMSALLPTLSARPDPQVAYASSAGFATSEVLRAVRDRGRAGRGTLAYAEWCALQTCADERCRHEIDTPGCALDDVNAWQDANPLMGRRRANGTGMTTDYIASERLALASRPWEFARERLGWWDEAGAADVFGPGRWEEAASEETPGLPLGAVALAVTRDLQRAAVVGAGKGDRIEVKPIKHGPGIGWVTGLAASLQQETGCRVVMDERGPSAVLLPRLLDAGVEVTPMTTVQVLDACALFYDGIREKAITHGNYPELNAAVGGAVKRNVQDRWAWGRRESAEDISVLEAATFAAWAVGDTAPPKRSYYEDHRLEVI